MTIFEWFEARAARSSDSRRDLSDRRSGATSGAEDLYRSLFHHRDPIATAQPRAIVRAPAQTAALPVRDGRALPGHPTPRLRPGGTAPQRRARSHAQQ